MSNDHDTQTDAPVPQFEPVDADHDGATDRVGIDDDRDGKVDRDADVYSTHFGDAEVDVAILDVRYPERPKPTMRELLGEAERRGRARGREEVEPELRRLNASLRKAKSLGARIVHWLAGGVSFTTLAYMLMAGYYGKLLWPGNGVVAPPAPASQGAVYRLLRDARDSRSDLWLVIVADEADAARVEAAMKEDER